MYSEMFYYIENKNTSPSYNLALEQIVFDQLDKQHSFCMLWQNHNAIIVGKHQNTAAEINASYVDAHGISVVRRLSGGGAVYHDLGNINYTFITDANPGNAIDFATFCKPIQAALRSFGVPAEISGRNDMTIDEKKFSGNAQYVKHGRIMHHGTLLYDSDMGILSEALIANSKIASKGIKSVRSRVTNIRPYMHIDMTADDFITALRDRLCADLAMEHYTLTASDTAAAQKLRDEVYSQWNWNYGASPEYNARKKSFIEGCGTIEVFIDVAKEGKITGLVFYGDFFGSEDPRTLAAALTGRRLEREELSAVMKDINVSRFFHNMRNEQFLSLLLG